MNWQRNRPRLRLLLGLSVTLLLPVAVLLLVWPAEKVTKANFEQITLGMAPADLVSLLGSPQYQTREWGLVQNQTYIINPSQAFEEQRARGFQECLRQQWASPEIGIVVISDLENKVICKYSTDGRKTNWFHSIRVWFSRLF